MPGVPPDALDQVKKAFKGMFRNRRKPGDEHHESTHAYQPTSTYPNTQQRPTSTQPAAPASAPVPLAPPAKEAATPAPGARQASVDSDASEPVTAAAPNTPLADHPTAPVPTPASKTSIPVRPGPATVESTDDIDLPTTTTTTTSSAATVTPGLANTVIERVPGMSATSGPLEDNPEYRP